MPLKIPWEEKQKQKQKTCAHKGKEVGNVICLAVI